LRYHPDRQGDKSEKEKKEAEEKFKEVSWAYDILSNPEKKQRYDQFGITDDQQQMGGADFDPTELFKHFMGGFSDMFGGSNARQEVKRKGTSLRVRVGITLEDCNNGCEKKIKYRCYVPCEKCNGTGADGEPSYERCKSCGGTGQNFSQVGSWQRITICNDCGGTGKKLSNPCKECNGKAVKQSERQTTISIPKGAIGGMQMVLSGQGNAPVGGKGVCGDLIVDLVEKEHNIFKRQENNIIFNLEIPVIDAILGTERQINTIDGKKLLAKIPSGVEDGYKIRFKGYGLPIYGTKSKGDMIGIVRLKIPKKINAEEAEMLNKLKESENFK
jgi:molecular chaperone DnaJ